MDSPTIFTVYFALSKDYESDPYSVDLNRQQYCQCIRDSGFALHLFMEKFNIPRGEIEHLHQSFNQVHWELLVAYEEIYEKKKCPTCHSKTLPPDASIRHDIVVEGRRPAMCTKSTSTEVLINFSTPTAKSGRGNQTRVLTPEPGFVTPKVGVRKTPKHTPIDVWPHFTAIKGKASEFKCNHCLSTYKAHGKSTTNLRQHLELKHPLSYVSNKTAKRKLILSGESDPESRPTDPKLVKGKKKFTPTC